MYYAISVPLIMTENMRFQPYSYPCFLGHYFLMGGPHAQYINEKDILCPGCQYTDLYSQLICNVYPKNSCIST